MNRTLTLSLIAAGLLTAGIAAAAEKTITLTVKSMYCASCPYIVRQSLARVAGVDKVAVSFADKTATVTYNDQKAALAALTAATTEAGYPSRPAAEAQTNN